MHAITRRHLLKLGLASGALVAAASSPALALVNIVVSGGNFTPLPIAIPDFGSSDPSFGAQIAQIVRDNLSRSGLFAPLPPSRCRGWSATSAIRRRSPTGAPGTSTRW